VFVQTLQCRPAKEQDEIHSHLVQRERFCHFHRNPAISAPPATAPHQYPANTRDGNSIPLNFDRLTDQPHMTNRLSSFNDKNVLFRGPPLQLVRTRLAGASFSSGQVMAICRGIGLHDLDLERFPWPGRFRLPAYLDHVSDPKNSAAQIKNCLSANAAEIVAPLW
jgi:hypothetical protein